MERHTIIWIIGILAFFTSAKCNAQTFTVLFVDQNDHPIENVVALDPTGTISSAPKEQTPAIMDQVNMKFSPMVIAIQKGRSVSFPNSDNIRHHVYSFSEAKRFETKLYANTPDSPIEFNQPGLVVLGCNIHDTMIGYIFVSKTEAFSISDAKGKAVIDSTTMPKTIEFWHPWSDQPNKIQALPVHNWPESNVLTIKMNISPPPSQSSPSIKRFGNRW